MKFYSTNNHDAIASLQQAVMQGLAPDGGLYMPTDLPKFSQAWLQKLPGQSFNDIALYIAQSFFKDDIPNVILEKIIADSYDFEVPLISLDQNTSILELFHGPTMAFKDIAARFMARIMSYYVEQANQPFTIIVATSGDTGSAVANAFLQVPGINVVIAYPSGRVSHLQEQQLTTMGHNITALEIQGSFDDCQALVKNALQDAELRKSIQLGSANSINIARLLPQVFYYFSAYAQLPDHKSTIVFSVPSGNFGNLTAGLIAKRLGLPVHGFVAATNSNDVVPEYLHTGEFRARPSQATISNAMDVGNPSNFVRMLELYNHTIDDMRRDIFGVGFSDEATTQAMYDMYQRYHYIADPHTAVGYLGLQAYSKRHLVRHGIVLATAHSAKFVDIVEPAIHAKLTLPVRLSQYLERSKKSILLSNQYKDFKQFLLDHYVN